uniref:Uncharacterized protein n=1 Tax=viral metagenome TaxID=1070528 RepID=A0A6C0E019_9ZZZZ
MDIDLAFGEYSMMLEPRLQEYMRRKQFNKQNNIIPDIDEEQEFSISKNDIEIINRYKKGKTYSNICGGDYVKTSKKMDGAITDNKYEDDPRFQIMKEKNMSNIRAKNMITDFEGIDKEYTIFHETNPYDRKQNIRNPKISKPYHTKGNNFMIDSKDEMLYSQNNTNLSYNPNNKNRYYHHEPKIAYNQVLTPQISNGGLKHTRNVNNIIGNLDNYEKHLNNTYAYIDPDTKNNNREKEQNYRQVPLMYGQGIADVSLEDSMRGNVKDTKKKSAGFKNPFSNYFSFISEDISSPEHTVNMRPVNTRGANKEIARPQS